VDARGRRRRHRTHQAQIVGGEQVYESPRMGGSSRLGRRPVASGLLAVSAWRVVTDQRWTVAYQETADPNDKMCFAVLAREG
jgi:hypothetical protein